MVKDGNFIKLPVAAEMIEVSVRVDNYHRFVSHICYCVTQVPNSTTSVDQGRDGIASFMTLRPISPVLASDQPVSESD